MFWTQIFAAACNKGQTFFGLPPWYQYVPTESYTPPGGVEQCRVLVDFTAHPRDILLVSFGIFDILLRIAGMIAVGYVIYGGFLYMTSQGEPDKTQKAKNTLLGAFIGLIIVLIAVPLVTFIGNSIGGKL